MKKALENTGKLVEFAPKVGGVFSLSELSSLFDISSRHRSCIPQAYRHRKSVLGELRGPLSGKRIHWRGKPLLRSVVRKNVFWDNVAQKRSAYSRCGKGCSRYTLFLPAQENFLFQYFSGYKFFGAVRRKSGGLSGKVRQPEV